MKRCSTTPIAVIASPGVSLREPFMMSAAIRGVPIIGDIELFAREAQAPIAAITGTNGKSTVTTLVARMAEAAGKRVLAGGNLGRPALDLLEEPVPELYVLELSSFQLETTRSLRTAAAVVLNVTPDHMDRYESVGEYAAAKARIFQHCDAAVINLDDPLVQAMPHRAPRVLTSVCAPIRRRLLRASPLGDDVALMHGERQLLAMSELKIAGLHNVANALAALAMCDALQLCARARACRRCASSRVCRIARSGSPTCAACATSTIRRARTSARRSRPWPACPARSC